MARPKTKGEYKTLCIKIDSELFNKLDKQANKTGSTKTFITEKALERYLGNEKDVRKEK